MEQTINYQKDSILAPNDRIKYLPKLHVSKLAEINLAQEQQTFNLNSRTDNLVKAKQNT